MSCNKTNFSPFTILATRPDSKTLARTERTSWIKEKTLNMIKEDERMAEDYETASAGLLV